MVQTRSMEAAKECRLRSGKTKAVTVRMSTKPKQVRKRITKMRMLPMPMALQPDVPEQAVTMPPDVEKSPIITFQALSMQSQDIKTNKRKSSESAPCETISINKSLAILSDEAIDGNESPARNPKKRRMALNRTSGRRQTTYFMSSPDINKLDESTSSLDYSSSDEEEDVYEAMRNRFTK